MKYRLRVPTIDAIRFEGNISEVITWLGDAFLSASLGRVTYRTALTEYVLKEGWWIIRESNGYLFARDHDTFVKMYEPAPDDPLKAHCSNWLKQQGQVYPRTCRRCGLGPCRKGLT